MNCIKKRDETNRNELVEIIARRCVEEGANSMAEGLNFYKHSTLTPPFHGLYSPSICIIAQGAKEVQMGEERFRYDPANYLLCAMDVPVMSQVVEASSETPFLGLKLDLDPAVITSVSVEAGVAPGRSDSSVRSIDVSKLEGDLLDAFVRLFRLLDNPQDYRVISPMVTREIIYRLLKTEQGPRLRQMATFGGNTHRITQAVQKLRTKFPRRSV